MICFRLRTKWQNCRGYVPRYERTPKNGWFDIHSVFATQKENWQWRTCFVTKHSKVDEEMSEDKIHENLNKKLDEIKAFEEKVKAVM